MDQKSQEKTNRQDNQSRTLEEQAAQLLDIINTLSLFARVTMNTWLPGLLSELNLTEERYIALFELNLQPGISLKQMAQSLMVSPSNLSVMVNAMVKQGLVERVTDPDDRRRVLLELSAAGKDICRKADAYAIKQLKGFVSTLGLDDREMLYKASEQMIRVARKIIRQQGENGR